MPEVVKAYTVYPEEDLQELKAAEDSAFTDKPRQTPPLPSSEPQILPEAISQPHLETT